MAPAVMASQALIAQCIGLAAGAIAMKSMMDHEASMAPPMNPCATCHGTRKIPCMCNKWSDGDVGCGTCNGSGRMLCSSCGGSGKGRPAQARITVRSSSKY
ncbi:hypothetical protein CLOM_g4541 [Closterium sp. NIES-68]|nr:hypothetical protein CLOM_g4541 [Closterium sp. NIES-68]GJP77097.1 hypothetical protein CLOP_g7529 [Closterium sp. NIES-67]